MTKKITYYMTRSLGALRNTLKKTEISGNKSQTRGGEGGLTQNQLFMFVYQDLLHAKIILKC